MNKKQTAAVIFSTVFAVSILIFPPKALIRDKKVIMRCLPFEKHKIQSRGITIETSYFSPNLTYDWQRLALFMGGIMLCGFILTALLKDK